MASKLNQWFKDRLSLDGIMESAADEKIPGGASFFYTLGSSVLFVFTLMVITGVWHLFYYVPSVDHAYESLSYLRTQVPFGWLIHGIHYWGANIMAILVALHMIRVFIWGAYKKPRELTWLIGIVLLLLVVGLIFTGALLPWDERGYWAAEVGTNIAGSVPVIGSFLQNFLQGGIAIGQLTLSRFYVLHIALIPGISFLIIVFHLMAFRKFGSVGPWKASRRTGFGDFWPDQVAIDLIVSGFIFLLIVGLSVYFPTPFTGPADPADTAFQPKPEWNFLFLYQILKIFKGPLEIIGTVGIPSLIIFLLVIVPFIDRKKSHNPAQRIGMMIGAAVFIGLIITFTILGYYSKPPGSGNKNKVKSITVKKQKSIKLSASALSGKKMFETMGCTACHVMSGIGGKVGPDLTNEYQQNRLKQWLMVQITDSKKHYESSIMPDFKAMTKVQLGNLVDYLLSPHPQTVQKSSNRYEPLPDSLKSKSGEKTHTTLTQDENTKQTLDHLGPAGKAATMIGNITIGAKLFRNDCESCHGVNGEGGRTNFGSQFGNVPALNPISKVLFDKDPKKFAQNIDRFIQHGAVPPGPNPTLKMLDFGDSYSLTQPEIAGIEAYILGLNGVDRGQIDTPKSATGFFFLTLWIYIGLTIFLTFLLIVRKKRKNNIK